MTRKSKFICNHKLICALQHCYHGRAHEPLVEIPMVPASIGKVVGVDSEGTEFPLGVTGQSKPDPCTSIDYLPNCWFAQQIDGRVCVELGRDDD